MADQILEESADQMSKTMSSKNLAGDVNGVTPNQEIVGWAADPDQPELAIQLDIIINGEQHTTTADKPRPDLQAKFPNQTNHGFVFPLPKQKDGQWKIEVKYADTGMPVPRGKIEYKLPSRPQAAKSTLKSDVNALGQNGEVAGWVFDSEQPSIAQDVKIEIGTSTWEVPANILRADVKQSHPDVANCGFKWPVPPDTPPGLHRIKVSHARSKQVLSRGSGTIASPLRKENATGEIDTSAWSNWKDGEATVEATVDCECFYSLSLVVHQSAVDDLNIRIRSAKDTCNVIDTRRAVREGRSITFERKALGADRCLVSVRFCLRRTDGFPNNRFLGKKWPETVLLSLTARNAPADRPWLSNYLETLRLTPPLLSFDVEQDADVAAQSSAIASLPHYRNEPRQVSGKGIFQIVNLFIPATAPELNAVLDEILDRNDVEAVSKFISVLMNCQPFKRNAKSGDTSFGRIVAFDGWYDLNDGYVNDVLMDFRKNATVIAFETQYEVSRLRVISDETWGLLFIGSISAGRDFHAFVSDYMDIIVNFRDPAGGDTSAILKFLNVCLNSGCPCIIPPEDISKSGLATLLNWVFGTEDSEKLAGHLGSMDPGSVYFRSYISHRTRCKMAPLVRRAISGGYSGNRVASGTEPAPQTENPDLSISVITVSKRPWMIKNIMENFERQSYPHKDHIIVLHGDFDTATLEAVSAAVRNHPDTRIVCKQKWLTLGSCINAAIGISDADYVAKFDDDDFYGENFLGDAARQIWMVGAEIYTQPLSLIYLEYDKKLVYLPEASKKGMRFVDPDSYSGFFGSGGTLIIKRHVAEKVKFSDDRRGGLDSDWFFRAVSAGYRAHVGGGFNYIFFRRADKGSHTWSIEDDHFLNSGVVLSEGTELEQAMHRINAGGQG